MRLVLLLMVVAMSSCGNRLCEGWVVSKHYEPRRVYTTLMPMGKMMMPQTHVDDEDFVLMVKGLYDGDTITERSEVSKTTYELARVGSYIAFTDCP